jgi:hypothetical protein
MMDTSYTCVLRLWHHFGKVHDFGSTMCKALKVGGRRAGRIRPGAAAASACCCLLLLLLLPAAACCCCCFCLLLLPAASAAASGEPPKLSSGRIGVHVTYSTAEMQSSVLRWQLLCRCSSAAPTSPCLTPALLPLPHPCPAASPLPHPCPAASPLPCCLTPALLPHPCPAATAV